MEEKISKLGKEINSLGSKTLYLCTKDLRLFLISEKNYLRISEKKIEQGFFGSLDDFIGRYKRLDRGSILDLFSKLEVIINHLIIFKIVGYDPEKTQLLDDILDKVDLHSRIKLLNKWNIIDNKFSKLLISAKQVRNGLAHYWDESDVLYKGKNIKWNSKNFFRDMHNIFEKLINVYMVEQEEKIDIESIITEIQEVKMANTK